MSCWRSDFIQRLFVCQFGLSFVCVLSRMSEGRIFACVCVCVCVCPLFALVVGYSDTEDIVPCVEFCSVYVLEVRDQADLLRWLWPDTNRWTQVSECDKQHTKLQLRQG